MSVSGVDRIDAAERAWADVVAPREAQIYALSTRLLAVARQIERSFEEDSRRDGLNTGETLVLDELRRRGPPYQTTATELKAHFLISLAGIGKRLSRLEELGLIERETDPCDRRSQIVRLTVSGLELLHNNEIRMSAHHTRALRSLPERDLQALSRLLKSLQEAISCETNNSTC